MELLAMVRRKRARNTSPAGNVRDAAHLPADRQKLYLIFRIKLELR